MSRISLFVALLMAGGLMSPTVAEAHFLWVLPTESDNVDVCFGEVAEPDDPDLLKYIAQAKLWHVGENGAAHALSLKPADDVLRGSLPEGSTGGLIVAAHDFGVLERGDDTFLLRYFAATGPQLGSKVWSKIDTTKWATLRLIPSVADGKVQVRATWNGKPIADAEVTVDGPGVTDLELTTDAAGDAQFAAGKPGTYSIRVRHIQEESGSVDGKEYEEVRSYSTLAIEISTAADVTFSTSQSTAALPELPVPVTSFGAAVLDGALYVYGGHMGEAHSYSNTSQSNVLSRLDLQNPGEWEQVATGPRLQGLALVAHDGKLHRLGGFTALNEEGEDHILESQADVAVFDPKMGEWKELPALPEPRSSFDAAVLGDTLYVIGGWQLRGEEDSVWHNTAWTLDLSAENPQWTALPTPPFQRRALAAAAHDGKVYAVGGMQQEGGPTTKVDVFDPETGNWSEGPALDGRGLNGFGCAAFATDGSLYVSTLDGDLQVLSEDGTKWETARKLDRARFFHRMLPVEDGRFVVVGGANMEVGKFDEVEYIDVN
ncbi:N-acetylneuraminate epimerase precursor [Maioricimonas rarisocia]|uniref:N-acetylneuraminate epimerase n=1 Tax=Maioricimonas rarisocia TaxID=2528026 RepID=A0A517Z7X2_9PLAN|nr:hypothetical protein [Maioricimonas rarisocia]QDU38590.1 N-acetylneuraminate epimerase precursor [Maioricimonas rarisocia]